MPDEFLYDVFLSHSAKDKAVVRDVAKRLRKDGPHTYCVGSKRWDDEEEERPCFPAR